MPIAESPQVRWYRRSTLGVAVLVCLALPSLALLIYDVPGSDAERREPVYGLVVGAVCGAVLTLSFWAPYRVLGFVGYASVAWLAAGVYGVATGHWPGWMHGIAVGLIVGSLARASRWLEPPEDTYWLGIAILLGAAVAWGFVVAGRPFSNAGYCVLALTMIVFGWVWLRLFRPTFELTLEPIVWLHYRIYGRGQGLIRFPDSGACIIIANHACWFDPLFLAKVIPRAVTPMMTSRFYNLPVLRRLMVSFGVIPVSEKALKKDTPEIRAAIAALDRGECLVIFPEGYLRRTEDQPLRRFGRGVWQILQARPNTPVFACWIEGGWGSYTSYWGGPPTKNKRFDFGRVVGVSVSPAVVIAPELLAEHLPTRFHLMNLVAAARAQLGLEPLPHYGLTSGDDKPADSPDEAA